MRGIDFKWATLALLGVMTSIACGSRDTLSVSPPDPGDPAPAPTSPTGDPAPVANATITVSPSGLSVHLINVSPGARVTFLNRDVAPHQFRSNPHPNDTTCPEINESVPLDAGASVTAIMANHAETCGFHDELEPTNTLFQGTIQVLGDGKDAGAPDADASGG